MRQVIFLAHALFWFYDEMYLHYLCNIVTNFSVHCHVLSACLDLPILNEINTMYAPKPFATDQLISNFLIKQYIMT